MKRIAVDCLTNYVFFVPLVVAFTPPLWSIDGALAYMRAAVPITLLGASVYARVLMAAYRRFGIEV